MLIAHTLIAIALTTLCPFQMAILEAYMSAKIRHEIKMEEKDIHTKYYQ
jgi:hypothetical protein